MDTNPQYDELEHRFRYHAPDEVRRALHAAITEAILALAKAIADTTPPGRGQSLALTKLEEARMWANQGVATATEEEIEAIPVVVRGRARHEEEAR